MCIYPKKNIKCTHVGFTDVFIYIYLCMHAQETALHFELHACAHSGAQCALQSRLKGGIETKREEERSDEEEVGGESLNESFWHRLVY